MVTTMQDLRDERPQSRDRSNLAEALALQHDYVNASYVYAGVDIKELNAQQLLRAGEVHFRAGLATKARVCFRDSVAAFGHARKRYGENVEVCCWLARSYGYLALHSWPINKIRYALTSRRYAERALQINPQHALSAYVLAMWHQKMPAWLGGRTARVGGYLDRAVEQARDRIMFRIARARWNLAQGAYTPAHADLKVIPVLRAQDPDDDRRKIEALALLDKHFTQAVQHGSDTNDTAPAVSATKDST